MNLVILIILIIYGLFDLQKAFLVIRKNESHVFSSVQLLFFIGSTFLPKKSRDKMHKEYKKRIKYYAKLAIITWSFFLPGAIFIIWLTLRE